MKNGSHLQTTFSDTFTLLKWYKIHQRLFLRLQLTSSQHCFVWWLGARQATNHYLDQWWPILHHHIEIPGNNDWSCFMVLCLALCFIHKRSLFLCIVARLCYLNVLSGLSLHRVNLFAKGYTKSKTRFSFNNVGSYKGCTQLLISQYLIVGWHWSELYC